MSPLIPSTAAPSDAPRLSKAHTQQIRDRRFYLVMAVASAVLVFLAFARTYYLKAYFGTPQLTALVEFHGVVFTTWMVFFVAQTALIASNRPSVHRRLGYAGGALASVMVVLDTVRPGPIRKPTSCSRSATFSPFPYSSRLASYGVAIARRISG